MYTTYEEFITHCKFLSVDKIKSLSTPRLLTYFKKHRKMDYGNVCFCGCGEKNKDTEYDLFVERYIDSIRNELNTREHIINGKEKN